MARIGGLTFAKKSGCRFAQKRNDTTACSRKQNFEYNAFHHNNVTRNVTV